MKRAFTENAELEMVVNTDAISFPASVTGLGALEDVLVRRFADDFENVYTFGLARPAASDRRRFLCPWLVGMSEKQGGPVRVGCGRYDWRFSPDERCLAERLIITIDVMRIAPAAESGAIMAWLSALPYPWCAPEDAAGAMPTLDALAEVRRYLGGISRSAATSG